MPETLSLDLPPLPSGRIPLAPHRERLRAFLGPWAKDYRLGYALEAETLSEFFARVLLAFLGERGLVPFDPMAEELAPLFLEALERELEKLALLSPPLTLEKVEKVVALRPPLTGFDLVRSVLEKDPKEALLRLRRLKEEGEEPLRLLGALSWQFALLARAFFLLRENPRPKEEDLARLEAHPYAARRALEAAKRLTEEALKEALDALMEAEKRAKGGKDPWLALEAAVLRLAG